MFVKLLKSKLHRARVTGAVVDYPGSVAIDPDLTDAVGIRPYEAVLLANATNGSRLETYVIPAERGSKKFEILGAAAKLMNPGDVVIVLNFGFFTPEEAETHKPGVGALDENNNIEKRIS